MKNLVYKLLLILFLFPTSIFNMDKESPQTETIILNDFTAVNALINLCNQSLQDRIQKLKQSKDDLDKEVLKDLNKCKQLNHIRFDYDTSFLGFRYIDNFYLQLSNSRNEFDTRDFSPNTKLIERINTAFKNSIRVFHSSKRSAGKSNLFTAHIDLSPLQHIFHDLLPWPNRHPLLFATGVGALSSLVTYMIMKKR